MQTVILMVTYIATTVSFQCIGFLISRLVDYNYPTLGLMTFLVLFLASFGAASRRHLADIAAQPPDVRYWG